MRILLSLALWRESDCQPLGDQLLMRNGAVGAEAHQRFEPGLQTEVIGLVVDLLSVVHKYKIIMLEQMQINFFQVGQTVVLGYH
ncbi:hypothetical protein D3C73_1551000 [compost metagenome]